MTTDTSVTNVANPIAGKLVLAVDDDELILAIATRVLQAEGLSVIAARDGAEAMELIDSLRPDIVLTDVDMPTVSGLELVRHLREDPELTRIPVVFLSSMSETSDIVRALELGGDDYLTKPFKGEELAARVRAKLARVPVPAPMLDRDPGSGLLTERSFREELGREFARFQRGGLPATLAWISFQEMDVIRGRLGGVAAARAMRDGVHVTRGALRDLDLVAGIGSDTIWVMMPETDADQAIQVLRRLTLDITGRTFNIEGQRVLLTPNMGYSASTKAKSADDWLELASFAYEFAASQGDLRPVIADDRVIAWARAQRSARGASGRALWRRFFSALRLPIQIVLTLAVGIVLPYFGYLALYRAGWDISYPMYLTVVVALLITGTLIWIEGILSFRAPQPPEEPRQPYPPATAIIAAYLPNEAATIMQTLETFLHIEYPNTLQVILAYNTPTPMPIEARLQQLTYEFPHFLALKVDGSTSKAQNVNGALEQVTGEFVGVFDADHMPAPGSFQRAWRWISDGYDIVQGHCMVRNGTASWIARMVAIEFEGIYAVSHPGRTVLHGFGLFGGSNGFWRTDRLHRTRMRSTMLTEDIDSSMRAVEVGARIASDGRLISAELATVTLKQLWNQRMRWSQGWFQVSLLHFIPSMRSRHLSFRQKLGMLHLLVWRELYPWISLQIFPIVAFWLTTSSLDWFVPVFVFTSIFTFIVGPGQTLLAYFAAAPDIKRHKGWFFVYLFFATLFYTEMKNIIVRIGQFKQLMGERNWRVTPRQAGASTPAAE
ncbi:MAG: response regulator [Dehalococcoidia bacterium]|nr:response regulator [Dehalococcoidia bacterium]